MNERQIRGTNPSWMIFLKVATLGDSLKVVPVPRDTTTSGCCTDGQMWRLSHRASLIGLLCLRPPSWNVPKVDI